LPINHLLCENRRTVGRIGEDGLTVLGWVAILSGLARMLFTTQMAAIAAAVAQKPGGIIAGAIIVLVLGAFLSFKGYTRD